MPEKLPIQTKINNSLRDEETYKLEKFERNAMMIFNHEHFLVGDDRRLGTALDVAALEDTFKKFRFDVTTCNDLTQQKLFYELERFSKMNFNDYGCICVAILTHGQDGGFLRAFDTRYREREAFSCFDALANPTLVGKPIIFLIQACRGSTAAARVPCGHSQHVEFDADTLVNDSRPTESDIIIFHSSFFGRASVRVVEEGSWFIQTLCEQMELHWSTDHLEELFLRVRQNVAAMEYNGVKQMPAVTTTLLKKLYLQKIDDTKLTAKSESDCRDDTYQPVDLKLEEDAPSASPPKRAKPTVQPAPRPSPAAASTAASTSASTSAPTSASTSAPTSAPSLQRTHTIKSLALYNTQWTIKARVTVKSDVQSYKKKKRAGIGRYFSMDLRDESGDIRAVAFDDEVHRFYDLIQVDKWYYINRGRVQEAKKKYKQVNNDYEIVLSNNTQVECADDDS